MPIFCLGSFTDLVSWYEIQRHEARLCPVTLRKSQHSNRLSLINFYRESKVEDLIVSLIASLRQFL